MVFIAERETRESEREEGVVLGVYTIVYIVYTIQLGLAIWASVLRIASSGQMGGW